MVDMAMKPQLMTGLCFYSEVEVFKLYELSICISMLVVRTSHSQISCRKHGFSHLTPFVSWAAG